MSTLNINHILIIEPKPELTKPYSFLPQDIKQLHLASISQAIKYLANQIPDLICLSSSYSPSQLMTVLEAIKESSKAKLFLPPLIFVIDLHHPTNFIPGTLWGRKFGIIHSLSSETEVVSTLKKITQKQKGLGFD